MSIPLPVSVVPSLARAARHLFSVSLLLVLAAVTACGGGGDDLPTSPSNPPVDVPFSKTDIIVGTGPEAEAGQKLTVHYAGWLYSVDAPQNKGLLLDTSLGRGAYQFTLGAGDVIRGWDEGIPGMQVGGVRRLVLPPELAYGPTGSGVVPPNTTLLFEIELLAIE